MSLAGEGSHAFSHIATIGDLQHMGMECVEVILGHNDDRVLGIILGASWFASQSLQVNFITYSGGSFLVFLIFSSSPLAPVVFCDVLLLIQSYRLDMKYLHEVESFKANYIKYKKTTPSNKLNVVMG